MNSNQPAPIENDNKPCWETVIKLYTQEFSNHQYKDAIVDLMYERDWFGRNKYGKPLRAFDGRDSFKEVLQEIADSIVYSQKAIDEGKDRYGIFEVLLKTQIIALENVYILYREQFFCKHNWDLFTEKCPEGCTQC
jgi:hypothetical protein